MVSRAAIPRLGNRRFLERATDTGTVKRALAAAVVAVAGEGLEVVASRPVGGGCISEGWWVDLSDGSSLFVKINATAAADLFECEAAGLRALAAVGAIRVPERACAGRLGRERYLAMEAIKEGEPGREFFAGFGRALAELHRRSIHDRFGFEHDNYIGATLQPNRWCADWTDFFGRQRLGHQLALARQAARSSPTLDRLADRLLERLGEWLDLPEEPACLLHGDLWSGNYLVDPASEPVLIDPACYYGHREADLAMTLLFGGFGPDFYAAYQEAWPLPAGSSERLEIYKLYHLLNHLNLFGGSYRGQCESLLERLV